MKLIVSGKVTYVLCYLRAFVLTVILNCTIQNKIPTIIENHRVHLYEWSFNNPEAKTLVKAKN